MSRGIAVIAICSTALAAGCFDDPAGGAHSCDACLECESCVEGPDGPTCEAASHQGQACVGDEIRWIDSCGTDEGAVETCPEHSECVSTTGGEAFCECTEHWEGEGCDVCPGNWDASQDCASCETNWEGDDCETCPGNWDPATNCDTCANHWIDLGDDCDTCPPNWDPAQDCAGCLGNFDPATGCTECLGNFDPATGCETCLPGWEGAGCDSQPVCVRYVDVDSTAVAPSGHAWLLAFPEVQPAIDSAADALAEPEAPSSCTVWVAEGEYFQYESTPNDGIALAPNVGLYGGFGGVESALEERDWEAHPTVLDGRASESGASRVYHVVVGAEGAALDGFTVRHGYAPGVIATGGGVLVESCAMSIANCAFTDNEAVNGGAVAVMDGGDAAIEASAFSANYASNRGGAIYVNGSSASVVACELALNEASGEGGGAAFVASTVLVDQCGFSQNTADDGGGALAAFGGSTELYGSTLSDNASGANGGGASFADDGSSDSGSVVAMRNLYEGNSAAADGGGAYVASSDAVSLERSLFVANTAQRGAGVAAHSPAVPIVSSSTLYGNVASSQGGGFWGYGLEMAALLNDIFWQNDPQQIVASSATIWVGYSVVELGYTGTANTASDPLFVDAAALDLRPAAGSPCIDAGHGTGTIDITLAWWISVTAETEDFEGSPIVDDPDVANTGAGTPDYIDIGAYEYQP